MNHEDHEGHEGFRNPKGFCFFVFSVSFVVTTAFGASTYAQSVFRSGVETVQVTVTVTDANGRLIPNLTKDDFEIFEDGAPQQVTQFTDKRVPVSLGVLLDASDS